MRGMLALAALFVCGVGLFVLSAYTLSWVSGIDFWESLLIVLVMDYVAEKVASVMKDSPIGRG